MRFGLSVIILCLAVFCAWSFYKPGEDGGFPLFTASTGGGSSERHSTDGSKASVAKSSDKDKDEQPPGTIRWNLHPVDGAVWQAPILIPDARMLPLDRQEVPSERDGQLLVIGTEYPAAETLPEDRRFIATVGSLLTWDKNAWRKWRDGDTPEPGLVKLQEDRKYYKRLEVGDRVSAGQVVAIVDPILALGELRIKIAALEAAESDSRASKKTKEEAERRVMAMEESMRRVPGSVSKDDYEGARLTAKRYTEEEIAKKSAVAKSQQELMQANTIVSKHEIHSTISGIIKVIYKNRGDAVKTLEPIMQIQSRERLRVEGLADVQDTYRIKERVTEVIVEPTQPISPKLILEGHLGEVLCVAVSNSQNPIILSGSEDQTLRCWNPTTGQQVWMLPHRSAVRCVACTGSKAKRNLAVVGCGDGSAELIDLDRLDDYANKKIKEQPAPRPLQGGRHRGAIHCVAFSVDGTVCATGGEDRKIVLWNTETGERISELPAHHRAPVTSLQFTPLNQLVSAGRDNQLVVWSVVPGKPAVLVTQFDRRSGDVAKLGVSPDGKQVLFDQGKEIRLLSIETHQTEGALRNPSGAANFTTMALFDPDGLTVLTYGGAEGRLQLWRKPAPKSARAAELRQLVWTRGPATSAAFSPDGSFCVTGTQDHHVLIWPMPERKRNESGQMELIETEIRARITKKEEFIDSSNRQVRVWVELENKDNRLVPGGTATMVVLPDSK
jgi:WD40 repeat protein